VKRFNDPSTPKKLRRSEPIYFYLEIVAAMFLPWSLLLPEATVAACKERRVMHSADRLCLVWSVVVLVFFSLSQSKLPGYILSVTVACGILLARLFDAALAAPEGRAARLVQRTATAFAVMCLVAAVAGAAGVLRWPRLVKSLRIPAADAEQLDCATVAVVLVLVGFGVVGLLAWYRRSVSLCFLCLALFPPVALNASAGALEVVFSAKSGRRIASQLAALSPQTEVACLECFPNGLPFYLRRTATLISRDGGELTSNYILSTLEKTSQWPPQIVRLSDFDDWLASRTTPVYLIVRQKARNKLEGIAAARGAAVQPLSPEFWGAQLPTVAAR